MADESSDQNEKNVPSRTQDMVLLGQAGLPKIAIDRQVERLCNSPAFDGVDTPRRLLRYLVIQALAGRVPNAHEIAAELGKPKLDKGDSFVRTNAGRVRAYLEIYYETAAPSEMRLEIPERGYYVLTPRNTATLVLDETPSAHILEPSDRAQVYSTVVVRGRIDVLNPDLRAWLVVFAPDNFYYPQCRILRRSPTWAYEVRIGRGDWGKTEDIAFEILLVSADFDGDFAFDSSVRARIDGFGAKMPTDVRVLDSRTVVRRDIRPEA